MPSFNQLANEGYDLRKVSKRATVLTLSAVAFTAISISVPEVLPYLFLYWAFVLIAVLSGKQQTLLGHPCWRITKIWKPILFGLFISTISYCVVLLAGSYKINGSFSELAMPTLAWVMMVATIEEFGFRWVLLTTLPYPDATSNIIFALLHPAVRNSIATGSLAGIWFFLGYLAFGLFLTVLVRMYERTHWFKGSEYLGPLLAITIHGAHNFFVIVWGVSIAGAQLVPM